MKQGPGAGKQLRGGLGFGEQNGVTVEHGETEAGRGLSLLPVSTNKFCSHLLYLLESMGDFVWKSVPLQMLEHCWPREKLLGLGAQGPGYKF